MSAAVTSATKVATAEADKSALSRSRASGGRRPPSVGSLKQDASPSVDTRASPSQSRLVRSTRRGLSGLRSRSWLRADSDSRGPSRPGERRGNLRRAYARPRDESGSIHGGDAGVLGGPTDGSGGGRPIPVGDRGVELYGPADRHGGRGRRHGDGKASQRHHDRLVTR